MSCGPAGDGQPVGLCLTHTSMPVVILLEGGGEGVRSRKPVPAAFAQAIEREASAPESAGSLWRTGCSEGQTQVVLSAGLA